MDIAEFKRDLFAVTCDMQRMLHDTMVPVCQQHDLTLQQFHVLLELTRTPGLTAGEASRHPAHELLRGVPQAGGARPGGAPPQRG